MKYDFRFKVWGYCTVSVDADSYEEAEDLIQDAICEVDCGDLEKIESEMTGWKEGGVEYWKM